MLREDSGECDLGACETPALVRETQQLMMELGYVCREYREIKETSGLRAEGVGEWG